MTRGTITAWMPETDQHVLAVLGKLAEECNELAGRCSRAAMQGLEELDPKSGFTNRAELGREVSDVLACIDTLADRLNIKASDQRVVDKVNGFMRWHGMIRSADNQELAHAVDLEQCSLVCDSKPLANAMRSAAGFIRRILGRQNW